MQTQKGLHSALTTECKQQAYKIFLACYYYQFVILTNIPLIKLKEKNILEKVKNILENFSDLTYTANHTPYLSTPIFFKKYFGDTQVGGGGRDTPTLSNNRFDFS